MKRIPLLALTIVLFVALGAGFLISSGWKEMDRSRQIEDEVERLRREAERIRGENRTLSDKIAFFSTESFEEREAKEKLGMRHEGEQAVVIDLEPFPESDTVAGISVSDRGHETFVGEQNYQKWLVLFGIIKMRNGSDT